MKQLLLNVALAGMLLLASSGVVNAFWHQLCMSEARINIYQYYLFATAPQPAPGAREKRADKYLSCLTQGRSSHSFKQGDVLSAWSAP